MKNLKKLPPVNVLEEWFRYDQETGNLIWRERQGVHANWNPRFAGKVAGTVDEKGYRRINLTQDKKSISFRVHRIVWAMHNGDTDSELDHINGDRLDNRIENLRLATRQQQMMNKRGWGNLPKGVYENRPGRFRAKIERGGKVYQLGTFPTMEQAQDAYAKAEAELFGEFASHDREG